MPKTIKPEADFSSLIRQIEQWAKANLNLVQTEEQVINVSRQLVKGQEILTGSIRGLNAAGEVQTTTVKRIATGWAATSQSSRAASVAVNEQTEALKRNAIAQEEAAAAAERRARVAASAAAATTTTFLGTQGLPIRADAGLEARFKNLSGQLVEFVQANRISARQVIQIWNDVEAGRLDIYTGTNRKIQQQILTLQEIRNRAEVNVQQRIRETAQAERDAALETRKRAAIVELEAQKFIASQAKIAKAIRERTLLEKEAAVAAGDAARASRLAAIQAESARTFLTRAAILPGGADQQFGFRLQDQIGKLTEFVRANNIAASQVALVWNNTANGIPVAYEGALRRVQSQIVAIQQTQQRALANINTGITGGFVATGNAANIATSRVDSLGRSTRTATERTNELLLSWSSIGRIIAGQIIRRAFLAFIQQVRQAVEVADDFLIKIGEVQTISQNNRLTTEDWAAGLRRLSDSFGIDILDQTESAYQALSNQIAEGAETFKILEEANKLALATVSSSSEAINALTAVLNSYGDTAGNADVVSAQLFKTIELGRIRLNEISNTIGTVTALAAELSIDFSSISAALATLTIRGIKANQAMTQIRGILAKLIKPSTEMKNLFREMGVESGEELIRSLGGLEGFLEKLATTTAGNTTELGKYISRLRGLSGAAILTSREGLAEFRKSLDEIRNSTASFDEAVTITTENVGKKFQIELNKAKNIFISDFGVPIVQGIVSVSEKIGGLDSIVKALANSITVILVPAVGQLAVILTRLATTNPLGATIIALGTLTVLATLAFDKISEENARFTADLAREEEKRRNIIERNVQRNVDNAIRGLEGLLNASLNQFAGLQRELNKTIDTIVKEFEELEPRLKVIFSSISKNINAQVTSISNNLKQIQRDITSAFDEIDRINKETRTELFEISIADLDIGAQIESIQVELSRVLDQASNLIGQGQFDLLKSRLKEGEKLFTQLRKAQEKAEKDSERNAKKSADIRAKILKKESDTRIKISKLESQLENTNDREKRAKIERDITELRAKSVSDTNELERKLRQIETIDFNRVDLAQQLVDFEQQRIAILRAEIAANRAREEEESERLKTVKELSDRIAEVSKRVSAFDIKDFLDAKNVDDVNKLLKDRVDRIQQLIKLGQDERLDNKLSVGQLEDLVKLQKQFTDIAESRNATLNLKEEKKERRDNIEALKLQVKELGEQRKALELNRTTSLRNIDVLTRAFSQIKATEETEQLLKDLSVVRDALDKGIVTAEAEQSIARLKTNLKDIGDSLTQYSIRINRVANLAPSKALGGAILSELDTLSKALATREILSGITAGPVKNTISEVARSAVVLNKQIADNALERNTELKRTEDNIDGILRKIAEYSKLLAKATDNADKETKEYKVTVDTVNNAWLDVVETVDDLNESIATQTKNLGSLAKAIISVTEANKAARETAQREAMGGMIRRFAFGGSVGTDTVPAMLSPGEFVVNARSTRKFFSQLVALNSSGARGYESGGQVTNVGDINVSMASSGNESVDVVKFGKLLRREIRRGTIRL